MRKKHIMGSSTVQNTPPVLPTMEDRKTIKSILTKPIKAFAVWKGHTKKKEKGHRLEKETEEEGNVPKNDASEKIDVEKMLENFHKLQILNEREKKDPIDDNDDEIFSYKIVRDDDELSCKEDIRTERTDSNISHDSGFSEKDSIDSKKHSSSAENDKTESDKERTILERARTNSEKLRANSVQIRTDSERVRTQLEESVIAKKVEDEILESLSDLKIEDGKKKKLQTVAVSRGPILNKREFAASAHPYSYDADGNFKQINQINKQTFSGGQVIYNAPRVDDYTEVDVALKSVERNLLYFPRSPEQQDDYWQMVQEVIAEDITFSTKEQSNDVIEENFLKEFILSQTEIQDNYDVNNFCANTVSEPNPIEEFHQHEQFQNLDCTNLDEDPTTIQELQNSHIYPTPPRSEHVSSPESASPFYPSNSDYTLSPEMSSPFNNDYEKYQEIGQYEDHIPSCVSEHADDVTEKKARERNPSTSSMSMKQYKDLQKELSMVFSKKECCQTNRKSTKEIFFEHAQKLKMEERKSLAVKVASMDLDKCYGVLQKILLSLSCACKQDDLHLALFRMICDRLSGEKPALFVGELGLNLLKAASLRCPSRPLLTRYLVERVRCALKQDPSLVSEEYVYREVDVQGDSLVTACARGGDAYADVLFELARRDAKEKPLFNVQHGNAEGYSALHVACQQHSADLPCLHVAHVLLEHAGADLWKGDVKGGDTAVHLAVNSPTCELKLVMVLFRHEDRKVWHKLSHVPNRSSVTPLEYARCAAKSTSRRNYPREVLEFLKKCR